MKFKTTHSEEREVEINFPMFRKAKDTYSTCEEFIAFLNEKTVYEITRFKDGATFFNVNNPSAKGDLIVSAFEKWEPISEGEYLRVHQDTLESMSLVPKLVNETETVGDDDLKTLETFTQ